MIRISQILIPSAVMGLIALGACSAHVSGGDGTPPVAQQAFMDPRSTITGPAVEGHWTSACNPSSEYSGYRQYDVTFKGSSVVRNEALFSDADCTKSSGNLNYSGQFRFIDKYSDGSYNIEYAFNIGNSVTTFPQEKILVAGNKLLVSEFVTGSLGSLLTGEPLMLVGAGGSNNANVSATGTTNVPAQRASNFSEAKYAYCATQGYGILLDFSGADLSTDSSGSARIGEKNCDSSSEVQWSNQKIAYTVNHDSGMPQIKLSRFFVNRTFDARL